MNRNLTIGMFLVAICMTLGGCVHFITPEPGSVAEEEARIMFGNMARVQGSLERSNLRIDYTMNLNGSHLDLAGSLKFDRSLTDSFRVIRRFFVKLNFIDESGGLIRSVDITPLFSYETDVAEKMELKFSGEMAPGTAGVVFSYFGVFRGDMPNMSEEWDISYMPFH